MSSILIKGMKKPENCFHCPMGYKYGDVDDPKLMCTITATVIPLGKSLDIMKNCPLVEIPPHGELIDKDKLINRCKQFKDMQFEHGETWEAGIDTCINIIEFHVPTVIESEDE